jgi:dolichol kinase
LVIGLLGAIGEALPIRLDDNLTIPLGVGFSAWIVCTLLGIRV